MSNDVIKDKLKRGDFKISLKRGQSKLWNVFGNIENENGVQIEGFVGCRVCFCVQKNDRRSTSNLNKHKCFINYGSTVEKTEVSGAIKKEAVTVFTKWVIQNCRPFKIVTDVGLKNVSQFLISIGAKYGANVNIDSLILHNTTVDKLYKIHFDRIKEVVGTVKSSGFGLTTDLWCDNFLRKTYLGLTMHCIIQGKLVNILLGVKSMNGQKCTSTVCFKVLYSVSY